MKTTRVHIRETIRRLAPMAAAAAAVLACLVATPASAQTHGHRGAGGGEHGASGAPGWGRGGGMGGASRGAPVPSFGREAPAGAAPGGRPLHGPNWDGRKYNGYWVGGRWYYGPPQQPAFETPGFRPGFTPWRRGSFLPPQYQGYEVYDFDRYHLRRPPYGYHWVQVGGEFLLVSVNTGLVFDVVTGG